MSHKSCRQNKTTTLWSTNVFLLYVPCLSCNVCYPDSYVKYQNITTVKAIEQHDHADYQTVQCKSSNVPRSSNSEYDKAVCRQWNSISTYHSNDWCQGGIKVQKFTSVPTFSQKSKVKLPWRIESSSYVTKLYWTSGLEDSTFSSVTMFSFSFFL